MRGALQLGDNLSYRLSILHFLMAKATQEVYSARGLTSHQWKVLSVLDAISPAPAREIAKHVTLDKAAISRAVRELRRMKLAEQRAHPDDARISDVVLTSKGRAAYAKMNADVGKLQARLFVDLSPQDRERIFAIFDSLERRLRSEVERRAAAA